MRSPTDKCWRCQASRECDWCWSARFPRTFREIALRRPPLNALLASGCAYTWHWMIGDWIETPILLSASASGVTSIEEYLLSSNIAALRAVSRAMSSIPHADTVEAQSRGLLHGHFAVVPA